jgi:hypothetical protein
VEEAMRFVRLLPISICGLVLGAAVPVLAGAADARPWLCRDKPVFSSKAAMTYQVANRGKERWQVSLMQFQPGTAHDGFEVIQSQEVPPDTKDADGNLPSGQYFAVAMYHSANGRWICPGYTRQSDQPPSGAVSQICFGDDPQNCLVTLTVRAAASTNRSADNR